MSTLNEANQANFEELDGHVKVLSAKLTQMTSGNTGVQTAIEDLEDYYERQIQMRVMHNTTLLEEIKEMKQKNSDFLGMVKRCAYICLIFFVLLLSAFFPGYFFAFLLEYWTYAGVAGMTFFLTSVVSGPPARGPGRKN